MNYSDAITKDFLSGNGTFIPGNEAVAGQNRWLTYEDQTYMGFWIYLSPEMKPSDYQDFDYLPQGLLMPDGPPGSIAYSDSAVSFLKRRNEQYRAAMIEEFQQGFSTIVRDAPWMMQSIKGVGDLWKIVPGSPWRTKDKKIVLTCLETIDLKMTYLLDLYRKAAFDTQYMRYILPDCQRYFSMNIIVAEVRTMQDGAGLERNTGTFFNFKLDYCEFDFFSEEPGYLNEISSFADGKAATVSIPIKVGKVTEMNSYGLLGAFLQDTYYQQQRGVEARTASFATTTTQEGPPPPPIPELPPVAGINVATSFTNFTAYRGDDFTAASADRLKNQQNRDTARTNSIGEGALGSGGAGTTRPPNKPQLNPLLAGALAAITNAVNVAGNSAKLGNIYGFSASNLAGGLQGLLNNPVGAIQGLLQNNGVSPAAVANLATKVELTSPEINLVKSLIGKVTDVSNIVAGTDLETATLGDLIKGVEASQNLQGAASNNGNTLTTPSQNLQGKSGKVELTAPNTITNGPQKVNLTGPTVPGDVDPVKIVLQSAGGSLSGSPGKTIFTGPSSTLKGSPGKVRLDSGQQKNESDAKEDLTGPKVSLDKDKPLGNVDLK